MIATGLPPKSWCGKDSTKLRPMSWYEILRGMACWLYLSHGIDIGLEYSMVIVYLRFTLIIAGECSLVLLGSYFASDIVGVPQVIGPSIAIYLRTYLDVSIGLLRSLVVDLKKFLTCDNFAYLK